jgi:hypothetical protein
MMKKAPAVAVEKVEEPVENTKGYKELYNVFGDLFRTFAARTRKAENIVASHQNLVKNLEQEAIKYNDAATAAPPGVTKMWNQFKAQEAELILVDIKTAIAASDAKLKIKAEALVVAEELSQEYKGVLSKAIEQTEGDKKSLELAKQKYANAQSQDKDLFQTQITTYQDVVKKGVELISNIRERILSADEKVSILKREIAFIGVQEKDQEVREAHVAAANLARLNSIDQIQGQLNNIVDKNSSEAQAYRSMLNILESVKDGQTPANINLIITIMEGMQARNELRLQEAREEGIKIGKFQLS